MRAARLIADTDSLAFPARTSAIIAAARALDAAGADALIAELAAGDRYSREVGLTAAKGARRYAAVLGFLADDEVAVRASAASALPGFGEFDAREALSFLARASAVERRVLVAAVVRSARSDLADALATAEHAAYRTRSAAKLLSTASAAVARELIDSVLPAADNAVSVARHHPGIFLAHAASDLASLPPALRGAWWQRRASAVLAAVEASGDVEPAFDLVEAFAPVTGWGEAASALLGALAAVDLERLVAVVVAAEGSAVLGRRTRRAIVERQPAGALRFARTLDVWALDALVRSAEPTSAARFLDAVFAELGHVPDLTPGLLGLVSSATRIADARRRIERDSAAGRATAALQARLPFEEAEAVLRPLTRESLAPLRAEGYRLLVESAGYSRDPAVVAALLASLTRLGNEQDPVRSAALTAIAALPVRVLSEAAIPALEVIVSDALEAPDLSSTGSQAIRTLGARLVLASSPAVVTFGISCLTRSNGYFSLPSLEAVAPESARRIVAGLLPVIDEHARVDRFDVLFELVRALGTRAHGNDDLDVRLMRATSSTSIHLASTAAHWWIAARSTRVARVRALIATDVSYLAVWNVADIVAFAASDLLTTPLLEGRIAGRFHTRTQAWWMPTRYAKRWTGRQRAVVAKHLMGSVTRTSIDVSSQALATSLASSVPGFGTAVVLAAATSESVVVRERAISLLGPLAGRADVRSVLTASVSTDRARVAGGAIVAAAGVLPPGVLEPFLLDTLAAGPKLTARKFIAFAAGRAHLTDPCAVFAAVEGTAPHRDVTEAVVSAQLGRLADPAALAFVVDSLAHSARSAYRFGALRPAAVSRDVRGALATRLADLCASSDVRTRQFAASAVPTWVAFSPQLRAAAWELVSDVTTAPTELDAVAIAEAILDAGYPEGLARVARRLVAQDAAVAADRDSLALRRIDELARGFSWSTVRRDRPEVAAALGEVVDVLTASGEHALPASHLALGLLVRAHPGAGARLSAALAGRSAVAVTVVATGEGPADRVAAVIPELARQGIPEQLVAVGLLATLPTLTAPRWQDTVAALRASADPDVRERARRLHVE